MDDESSQDQDDETEESLKAACHGDEDGSGEDRARAGRAVMVLAGDGRLWLRHDHHCSSRSIESPAAGISV